MQNDKSGMVIIKVTLTLICLLLFAVGQPAFSGLAKNNQIIVAREKLWFLQNAMINFSNDLGFIPSKTRDLENLTNKKSLTLSKHQIRKRWKGPYIEKDLCEIVNDPWNTPIRMVQFQKTLFLQSAGPDKEFTPVKHLVEYSIDYDDFESHDDILIRVGNLKKNRQI